jgi:hypothetical protein
LWWNLPGYVHAVWHLCESVECWLSVIQRSIPSSRSFETQRTTRTCCATCTHTRASTPTYTVICRTRARRANPDECPRYACSRWSNTSFRRAMPKFRFWANGWWSAERPQRR